MSYMGIFDTFNADRDVTYLAVSITFLFGMSRTLKKIKLYCTICERNNVVGSRRKVVNMFVDAFSTETNLAAVAELLDRFLTEITGNSLLGPSGGSRHYSVCLILPKLETFFAFSELREFLITSPSASL